MWAHIWAPRQPPPTFSFGLTKNFFFIYRTLSMRQKTINLRNQGSFDKKIDFFSQTLSHIPRWVCLEQKTRAKNSHAWAPLSAMHLTQSKAGVINFDLQKWETLQKFSSDLPKESRTPESWGLSNFKLKMDTKLTFYKAL